jgi:uncharacterized protein (DUF1697 family)
VLLLRGINLGPSRRVPMAELRALLSNAGYEDVATYVQSGNVVLSSPAKPAKPAKPAELESSVAELVSDRFGFEVPVCARSASQLAKVMAHDPIPGGADDPKRYQVTFLAERAPAAVVRRLEELAAGSERVAAHGRELYTYHPDGIARSKLAKALTASELGIAATARNWTTVRTLAEMASRPST